MLATKNIKRKSQNERLLIMGFIYYTISYQTMRRKKFIFSLILFFILVLYQRLNPSEQILSEQSVNPPTIGINQSVKQQVQVVRVIDGDTIEILLNNKNEKVRIIGINAPESVDPRRSVECFGKEASDYAKNLLTNQVVTLEPDPGQRERDKYGRLLRYVFINDVDFGFFMITHGYAYEYTYDLPYKYQSEYKKAEEQAREEGIGLWRDADCNI